MATLLEFQPLLEGALRQIAQDIDAAFDTVLHLPGDGRDRLFAAMRHAAIGGGKRLRPLLVRASADLFGVPRSYVLQAGLAIESLHVQSLIHDDLPCMDDDDLRRGRPTVHCAFDEATAVLAGDALQALAFELLSDPATHPDGNVRSLLVARLARCAGGMGMAGGQMLDLLPPSADDDERMIVQLQSLKTGALIGWAVEAGAILAQAEEDERTRLCNYAQCVGLAFQIADDLLDVEGCIDKVGKRLGKDQAQQKATFVSLLGTARARDRANELADKAIGHIAPFGSEADLLREIAIFAVQRDR
ncbi:polyprenyl synthetase family protein [Sphingomonas sp. SRS2]|uniref:polyprenyl synthetase family protein n=1 Tax=Sphingomonas sp. SRS2 TaxID=133190 RepID=UPI0006184AFF|nr:farnesyl diphosphate synthase [Sphingomonas sp. SRS2]KKC26043.1 farnesyl-diphosphate synthase [Sphingomonas sp. SRS2]